MGDTDTTARNRPNVLWLCTDQQRFDTIRRLGNDAIETPNLDRLVNEGVAFDRAYCQSPVCTPSRASFLTGCYPSSVHGCMNGNERWGDGATLLPKLFADAGYHCGLVGKRHLAGNDGQVEPRGDDGYDFYEWCHAPRDEDEWGDDNAYTNWLAEKGYELDELRATQEEPLPSDAHYTTWCTETAAEFVRSEIADPWLLSVNFYDPHPPFNPPEEYRTRYDPDEVPGPHFEEDDLNAQQQLAPVDFQSEPRDPETFDAREKIAAYYAMVEMIDDKVGHLLDELERTGQRENTIIVFMSDHGEMLGDHGLLLKGCRFYEGLTRVPLIFSYPRRFETGVVSDALVELTDVAPTLADVCDVDASTTAERFGGMQGRSLVPLLTGRSNAAEDHRSFVRCEYYHALNPDSRPDSGVFFGTMLRTDRYKLTVYHGHDAGELFDLENDPHEFENLWNDSDHRDVRERLLQRSFDQLALAVDRGPEQIGRY